MISADGSAAICPRTPSEHRAGEAGYLHKLINIDTRRHVRRRAVRIRKPEARCLDLGKLAVKYRTALDVEHLRCFAGGLGLSCDSLMRLGIGWAAEHGAFAFPMLDHRGSVCGIRLRSESGHKWAVRGGYDGLLIPSDLRVDNRLLITEGPTDTAAALDLGFDNAIGRPSCQGGTKLAVELVNRLRPAEVVIVSDRDTAGIRGANSLAATLIAYVPIRVITSPERAKDLRSWKCQGATQAEVDRLIDVAKVRKLRVQVTA